jgi:hypothetical protein
MEITATSARTTETTGTTAIIPTAAPMGITVTTRTAVPMEITATSARTTAIQAITVTTTTVARTVTMVISVIPIVTAMDRQPGRCQPQGPGQ